MLAMSFSLMPRMSVPTLITHAAAAVSRIAPEAACDPEPLRPWPYIMIPIGAVAVYAQVGMTAVNGISYMPWYAGRPSLPSASVVAGL